MTSEQKDKLKKIGVNIAALHKAMDSLYDDLESDRDAIDEDDEQRDFLTDILHTVEQAVAAVNEAKDAIDEANNEIA